MDAEPLKQFMDALAIHQLNPKEVFADGTLHRFSDTDDKPGVKSAWYVLHKEGDFFAGAFGNWRMGFTKKWCSKSPFSIPKLERRQYVERIKQCRKKAFLELEEQHAAAAAQCLKIWETAQNAEKDHPYLLEKCVSSYGLKQFKDQQTLIVAARDVLGNITSLQFIDEFGNKKFKAKGRKLGCFFSIGDDSGIVILICEGYATGATLYAATGHYIVVAFDAGNLEAVGQALRKKYPEKKLLFCADNDRFKVVGNIGLIKATKAADTVGGEVILPVFKSDNGEPTDFNDLQISEGLETVKAQIDAAMMAVNKTLEYPSTSTNGGLPPGFTVSKSGVYFTTEGGEDKQPKVMKICSPLFVTAMARDNSSHNWGRVVEFYDSDGIRHQWTIPMEMLASDGAEMRKELSRLGLIIAPGISAKNKLLEYISSSAPNERARCVQQTGWYKNVFVMPNRTIGNKSELVLYQSESKMDCQYQQNGSLEQWRTNVANLCRGNSRLVFALSASFAGMMLFPAGQESSGFHFVGSSSTGKSTTQLVAASVYGSPAFKQSWRATGNALEGTCSMHNDAALILDEMAEVDPKDVGSIVYMIGNGTGKGRASRNGGAKQRKTWRIMVISSGEIGLAQHMRDGGKNAKAGQEVRMIDIAADAGAGHGMFECLHNFDGGAKLSDAIKEATQSSYGTPAIAFLEQLTNANENLSVQIKEAMAGFVSDYLPSNAGGQAVRVCNKFAMVAIAGEYATDAGITGWQEGDAVTAAATCFKAWVANRGGAENQERAVILSSVKAFFESHGESRFADLDDSTDRVIVNRTGFKKSTYAGQEFYVLTEVYKRDICAGFEMKAVSKVLADEGWLAPDNEGKTSQRRRLPGLGVTRCYVFTPKMWEV